MLILLLQLTQPLYERESAVDAVDWMSCGVAGDV
jgi:hypothetical protein